MKSSSRRVRGRLQGSRMRPTRRPAPASPRMRRRWRAKPRWSQRSSRPEPGDGVNEAALLKPGSTYVGFLAPLANPQVVAEFTRRKVTSFAMEYIPRITRAQSMDALSSMATIAGYKAVLIAADRLGKMFPLLMTAAGTIPPANVLILGAGVAGLQAIATARRLGARVEAFDPRPAVKEQVKSLGAGFLEMEVDGERRNRGRLREADVRGISEEGAGGDRDAPSEGGRRDLHGPGVRQARAGAHHGRHGEAHAARQRHRGPRRRTGRQLRGDARRRDRRRATA